MQLRNTSTRYGLVTKGLHWTLAPLMFFLVWLGWYMVGLSYFDKWYNWSLSLHKSFGMLGLGLALVFVLWKLVSPSPRRSASIPSWQHSMANWMHLILVLLMFAVPLSGYLISTSAGGSVAVFGLVEVPALIPAQTWLRDVSIAVHFYLAYALGLLAVGHALAAIKHQLVDRDGTLARMLWG